MTDKVRVGVAGAGVMGAEVAQVCAASGHEVVLLDVGEDALERARSTIAKNLRFARMLGGGSSGDSRDEILARITTTTDVEAFAGAGFVVENITEDWELKRELYGALDRVCPPDAPFAVNTSVIPITKVGGWTNRAPLVIGTHFMNPVSQKPVVEVIRGFHTEDATVGRTLELLASIGKKGVVVRDSPGFVSNRVLMLTVNEAVFLLQEDVSTAEDVDEIFRSCFGHRMGPLETADLIGLDTVLRSIELLHEFFGDSKYRPCPLLARMVDAGLHGRKSGAGFYRYAQPA